MLLKVYVDDLLLPGSNEGNLKDFRHELMNFFEMTNLGLLSTYLGIQVIQGKGEIILNQNAFELKLLKDQ